MDYMSEYKRWLDCSALSADEHAELAAVADNQEEIESRFFAPLSVRRKGLFSKLSPLIIIYLYSTILLFICVLLFLSRDRAFV